MSKRGKRGVALPKKYDDYTIEFDKDMQPVGPNAGKFFSWLGTKLRTEFSYHIPSRKFKKQQWEDLWKDMKNEWHIPSDASKRLLIRKAKKNCTDWRSFLTREFVNKGITPFEKYKFLDPEHWDEFVAEKTSPAFLERSKKAKASALANKNFARLGRGGYPRLTPKVNTIWAQLLAKYPHLENIQNVRSKKWIAGRAKKHRESKMYELTKDMVILSCKLARYEEEMIEDGSYYLGNGDPLTKLLGPEHGGRSRTVSGVTGPSMVQGGLFESGRRQNQNDMPTTQRRRDTGMALSPDFRGSSYASGGSYINYPPIEEVSSCELLYPYDSITEKIVGTGHVYPTTTRMLHGSQMLDGYVKVQVDSIDKKFDHVPLPPVSCYDKLKYIGDTRGYFIQWPRKAIKISNSDTPRRNQASPQIASDSYYQQQVIYDDNAVELLDPKEEQCELDENASPVSDPLENDSSCQSEIICVQGYKVKRSTAPILEAILKKHGDIAAECIFKTDSVRSPILEVVCEVVKRIQTGEVIEKMEELESQVSDAKAANIDVSWLQAHLEAIRNSKEAGKKYRSLKETKANTVLVKRAAEMDLKERCEELVAAQKRVRIAERRVKVLHLVEKNLSDSIMESKGKMESWVKHPVV